MQETDFEPVRLIEAQEVFKEILPGIELFEYPDTETFGFRWGLNIQLAKWQLVAVNSEEAKQRMKVYAEQARHKAIRELGLEPILEGLRQEVWQFKHENTILANLVSSQGKEITQLKLQIDKLENPEDYENEEPL